MLLRRSLVLLAMWIGACSSGAGLSAEPNEDGVIERKRRTLDAEGGSIELRDGSGIRVPRRALRESVELSVTARSGLPRDVPEGPELRKPIGTVLTVEPHGQRFDKDVELRVPVPSKAEERNLRLHTQKGSDDSAWERLADESIELREASDSGSTLAELRVRHFSHWAWFEVEGPIEVEEPPVSCEPGQAGEDCEPCEVGRYCPGGDASAMACGEDQWDHDGAPATECRARRTCEAGQHVVDDGDTRTNRECGSCSSGTFSDTDNAASCAEWMDCVPGEYVAEAGTVQTDQVCELCEEGSFSASPNAGQCVAVDACPAGTVATESSDPTADVTCDTCEAGQYCAGGEAPAEPCGEGLWDHDANPASTCVERTTCPAGQFVVSSGDATTDRVCSACQGGTYSTALNATTCAMWTDCQPGERIATVGSQTADRTCEMCPEGTYSEAENSSTCTPLGSCAAGTVQTSPGSDTEPPMCADCEPGEYCAGEAAAAVACGDGNWDHDQNPASECVAWTPCVQGEFVASDGGATEDRSCEGCAAGTFSAIDNAAECTVWTPCSEDEYVSTPGSSTSDQVCSPEVCGNGHQGNDEVCDDGNTMGGDGCSEDCQSREECGNEIVDYEVGEVCDDGNIDDGDGCSADCSSTESCPRSVCDGATLVAGDNHTCALRDGAVWCWGAGDRGQLGSGRESSLVPVAVTGLIDAVALSAGAEHTCALREAGAVACWGAGEALQLGNGASADQGVPVLVRGLGQVVGVAAGGSHSCAWAPDGTVHCWGGCGFGQCGVGESLGRVAEPTPVIDADGNRLQGVVHVTLGQDHSCALVEGQRVFGARCWGRNDLGQLGLGDGGDEDPHPFVESVVEFPSAITLAAGRHHNCSVTEEGTAVCWGANEERQLGSDSPEAFVALPTPVSNLARLGDIQAGATHSCALDQVGAVYCWGSVEDFKLGHGSEEEAPFPTVVPGLEGSGSNLGSALEIALGEGHSCTRLAEGQVMCWGRGTSGQIGDGDNATAELPTPVEGFGGARTLDPVLASPDILDGRTAVGGSVQPLDPSIAQ